MRIASNLGWIWTERDFTLNLLDTESQHHFHSQSDVVGDKWKGQREDVRNRRGWVMRAKLSFSGGENIQFLRYYQVSDTGWFIMDISNIADS